jgi:hypothetical protein
MSVFYRLSFLHLQSPPVRSVEQELVRKLVRLWLSFFFLRYKQNLLQIPTELVTLEMLDDWVGWKWWHSRWSRTPCVGSCSSWVVSTWRSLHNLSSYANACKVPKWKAKKTNDIFGNILAIPPDSQRATLVNVRSAWKSRTKWGDNSIKNCQLSEKEVQRNLKYVKRKES